MKTYKFGRHLMEVQRDLMVTALRKDGFSASRETDTLRTNATRLQVALSWGRGLDLEGLEEETTLSMLQSALDILAVFAAKPWTAHEPAEWAAARSAVAKAKEGGLL